MPEDIIEEVAIRVLPSFDGFRASFDRQLKTAAANLPTLQVKAVLTVARITEQMAIIRAEADKGIKIKAELDTTRLEVQLATLYATTAKDIVIKVRYDESDRPNPLPRSGSGSGGGGGGGNNGRSGGWPGDSGGASGSSGGSRNDILSTFGGRGVRGTGAAVLAGIVDIGPLAATVTGLSSVLAAATAGLGLFGTAAAGAFASAKSQIDEFNKGLVSFDQLPKDLQELLPALNTFKSSWNSFVNSTRGPIFGLAIKGMQDIQSFLPRFVPVINTITSALGNVLTTFSNAANGPEATSFLATIGTQAPAALQSLARSAVNVGAGFLEIFSDFADSGQTILQTVEQLTSKFRTWADSMKDSQGFRQVIDYIKENGPKILTTIGSLVVVTGHLVEGLAPVGAIVASVVSGLATLLSIIPPELLQAVAIGFALVGAKILGLKVISGITTSFKFFNEEMKAINFTAMETGMSRVSVAARILGTSLKAAFASTVIGLAIIGVVTALDHFTAASEAADQQAKIHTSNVETVAAAWDDATKAVDGYTNAAKLHELQTTDVSAGGNRLTNFLNTGRNKAPAKSNIYDVATSAGISQSDLLAGAQGNDAAKQRVDTLFKQRVNDLETQKTFSTSTEDRQKLADEIALTKDAQKQYDSTAVSLAQVTDQRKKDTAATGSQNASATTLLQTFQKMTETHPTVDVQITTHTTDIWKQYETDVKTASTALQDYKKTVTSTANSAQSAFEAIGAAQKSAADASYTYQQSLLAIKAAEQNVIDTTKALVDAREQARRQLRDLADNEESLALQKIAADKAVQSTSGLSADDSRRRQALLDQKNIGEQLSDTGKDNAQLRKEGINGNPAVVSAYRAQQGAVASVAAATRDSKNALDAWKTAQHNVTKAQEAYHQALIDGKQARDDAYQHYKDSKVAVDDYYNSLSTIDKTFITHMKLDKGNTTKELDTVATYLEAIKLSAAHPELSVAQAWNFATSNVAGKASAAASITHGAHAPTQSDYQKYSHYSAPAFIGPVQNKSTGGAIHGRGTATSDSNPYLLSKGEHIVTASEVVGAGGHGAVEAQRMAWRKAADGGPVEDWGFPINIGGLHIADMLLNSLRGSTLTTTLPSGDSGSVSSPVIGQVQSWLHSIDPLPYVFGAVGPGAFDCSGLAGEVWARLTGNSSNHRYFSTATEKSFLEGHGFKKGTGAFTIGFNDHHTMGQLGNVPFEAANPRDGILIGSHTSSVTSFPNVYYLPQIAGKFAGTGSDANNIGAGDLSSYTGDVAGLKDWFLNGGGGSTGNVTGSLNIERIAELTARAAGATDKQLLSLFETGFAESGFSNSANSNVPSSLKLPHDNVGSDHTSVGYLQQQVGNSGKGAGWGTVSEAMNPAHATVAFLNAAKSKDTKSLTAAALAQAVQVSAFPGAYAKQRANAYAALNSSPPGISAGIYDNGGILRPGHIAINTSPDNETIRNASQEAALSNLSDADLRRLGTAIAQALNTRPTQVVMDSQVVGETAKKSLSDLVGFDSLGGI